MRGIRRIAAACLSSNAGNIIRRSTQGKRTLHGFTLVVFTTLAWTCFVSLTLIADSLPPYEKNNTCYYDNSSSDCVIQTITPLVPALRDAFMVLKNEAQSNNQSHLSSFNPRLIADTTTPTKLILRWTKFYNNHWDFPPGNYIFHHLSCPVNTCEITDDHSEVKEAAAILFHMRDISDPSQFPLYRHPEQRWVFYLLESPYHTQVNLTKFNGAFNWTSTYHSHSDIPSPYGQFIAHKNAVNSSSVRDLSKIYPGKTRPIAWFVTNCKAKNKRMEYVRELQKYISVDIYGNCGNFKCPNRMKCLDMLRRKYKFYLSFENSNCAEYITEKFWFNALEHDTVPIVMGAPRSHYQRLAPPTSFIHIEDFPSPHDLARYLRMLMKSNVLYNEFFRWKTMGKSYSHINLQPANSPYWCDLCAALHNSSLPSMVHKNLNRWWSVRRQCLH